MYEVASFIPSKHEDWDNGCGNTARADFDSFAGAYIAEQTVEIQENRTRRPEIAEQAVEIQENRTRRPEIAEQAVEIQETE
jgi:hypothetical protein